MHKSRRYHEKLSAFFARWRDRSRILTVVFGSGAFLIVANGLGQIAVVASAVVALWAILDLVLMPDKKAETHTALSRRFTALAAEIATAPRNNRSLSKLTTKRLEIEADEPPCKRLIDLEARNDEARARGYDPADQVPLTAAQRRLGYYFGEFGMARLERWKADRQKALATHH